MKALVLPFTLAMWTRLCHRREEKLSNVFAITHKAMLKENVLVVCGLMITDALLSFYIYYLSRGFNF